MKKNIYIMDAYAFIYRSYYAFGANKALTNKQGFNVSAIFGFFKTLHSLIKTYSPQYFVVALDSKVPTFRHKMYAQYKTNRRETPKDLHAQIPFIEEALKASGVAVVEMPGYEADDVMASLVRQAGEEDFASYIISGDKDLMQLVCNDVKIIKQDEKNKWKIYGEDDVLKDWGVPPSLILDLLSITGDVADNISGIKGIGIKGAVKLLTEYKSLQGIYDNLENVKGATFNKLLQGKNDAFFSKKLIMLDSSLNIPQMEMYSMKEVELAKAVPIFEKLGLPSLVKLYSYSSDNLASQDVALSLFSSTKEGLIHNEEDERQEKMEFLKEEIIEKEIVKDELCVVYDGKNLYHKKNESKEKISNAFSLPLFDVMIAAYLISPDKKDYSFSSIVSDFLEDNSNIGDTPLLQLYKILQERLVCDGLYDLFRTIEMPLIPLLAKMEMKGIKLDIDKLKMFANELDKSIKKLEEKAIEMAGYAFNLASYKQLQKLLFEERGLKPDKKGKTGFSTSSEVLEKLKDRDELVAIILEYRTLSKLRSTYTDSLIALRDEGGRVHTHFVQTGTATGRLSSQNPNLQNIPSHDALGLRIREAFCAEEGYVLISSDYSQIELRVLAHISKDEILLQTIREGIDVHKRTASLIFNVAEELVTDEMRAMAKAVNFGIIYGMSAYRLSEELHISRSDASHFIASYFETYKGVHSFIEETYTRCEKDEYVTTLMGRKRYVREINSDKKQIREAGRRIAVNTIIQGSAADIMKTSMLSLDAALTETGYKAAMLLQVHDELILESSIEDAEAVMNLVKEKMEAAYPLDVPLKVSISSGENWSKL